MWQFLRVLKNPPLLSNKGMEEWGYPGIGRHEQMKEKKATRAWITLAIASISTATTTIIPAIATTSKRNEETAATI